MKLRNFSTYDEMSAEAAEAAGKLIGESLDSVKNSPLHYPEEFLLWDSTSLWRALMWIGPGYAFSG